MIATKTLFHNADRSKVVPEGHEDAQFLIVREGQEISDADAEKYGLTKKDGLSSEAVKPVTTDVKPKIHAPASSHTHKAKKK